MSFLSFFTLQILYKTVLWSRRHCTKWQCSLFDRFCCINGYTKKQKQKKQNNCRHRNRCPRWASTARNFLWRNYVGDFRLVEFALARAPFQVLKERKKQTRLTLTPIRGSLGVLCTYSGSVVVLSWDLTYKNTQTSTQAHACRVTLTLARSTQTRAVRPVRV